MNFLKESLVCLYNINQNVTKVILRTLLSIMFHRRTNRRRRNIHHLTNHPVRSRVYWAESHESDILIRNATANFDCHLRRYFDNHIFSITCGSPLGKYRRQSLLSNFIWLQTSTTIVGILTTTIYLACKSEYIFPSMFSRQL